jgi:hypothetical protein
MVMMRGARTIKRRIKEPKAILKPSAASNAVDPPIDLDAFRKEILHSLKKVAGKGGVENVLARTPRFMARLKSAERRIKKGRGIKHRDFWKAAKKAK